MRDRPPSGRRRYTAGDYALTFGLAAVACALIPVIGDLIAAPVAVLAVVLGLIGISHHDSGRTHRVLPAAVGAALGAVALFVVLVMFLATSSSA
ncbi:hypothetical protein [Brachybacterium sp. FME24]|uniref:hypothetical protein n=1 Tax=Brachybacterium sp. FME24 TaxID=2742605 RepID=UPI00186765DF|nr:hypothetical protein [Brachybacterium sp. FME24]